MPNYKTHILTSIATTSFSYLILFYLKLIPIKAIIFLPYILFLSIISDIDSKKSKARKIINILFLVSLLLIFVIFYISLEVRILLLIVLLTLMMLYVYSLHHRSKVTHSSLFGLVLSIPLIFISPYLVAVAYISFATHLLLDNIY